MQKQTVEFAITRRNGSITKVGRSSIVQPKTNYKGGSIKFYKDTPKQTGR